MKIEFRMKPEGFRDLAKLLKKLEVFINANCVFYLIFQRPSERNAKGVMRFYINGFSQTMVTLDCNTFLEEITFKSIEDFAAFQIEVESFFKFIMKIQGHDSDYIFSLKRRGTNKFLQVEIPTIQVIYRTLITQTSMSRIGVWVPIVEPEVRFVMSRINFLQVFNWVSNFQLSNDDIFLISYGKTSESKGFFKMKAIIQRDSEFDVDCAVYPQKDQALSDISEDRDIGKQGFQIMKKVMTFSETTYFLKNKDTSQYCFDIYGNFFHIQVKLPTADLTGDQRVEHNQMLNQHPRKTEKSIKIQNQDR